MIWEAFLLEKTIGKLLGLRKKTSRMGRWCELGHLGNSKDKGETWKKIKTIRSIVFL